MTCKQRCLSRGSSGTKTKSITRLSLSTNCTWYAATCSRLSFYLLPPHLPFFVLILIIIIIIIIIIILTLLAFHAHCSYPRNFIFIQCSFVFRNVVNISSPFNSIKSSVNYLSKLKQSILYSKTFYLKLQFVCQYYF
jgi:hypothetical protein